MDEGNSARQILGASEAPVRTLIVGIVDVVEVAPGEGQAEPPRRGSAHPTDSIPSPSEAGTEASAEGGVDGRGAHPPDPASPLGVTEPEGIVERTRLAAYAWVEEDDRSCSSGWLEDAGMPWSAEPRPRTRRQRGMPTARRLAGARRPRCRRCRLRRELEPGALTRPDARHPGPALTLPRAEARDHREARAALVLRSRLLPDPAPGRDRGRARALGRGRRRHRGLRGDHDVARPRSGRRLHRRRRSSTSTGPGRSSTRSPSTRSATTRTASTTSPSRRPARPRARGPPARSPPTATSRSSSRPRPASRCARSASPGARSIEAPDGGVAVERLRIGDAGLDARRRTGRGSRPTVIAVGSTAAPAGHQRRPPRARRRTDRHRVAGPPARRRPPSRRPARRRCRRRLGRRRRRPRRLGGRGTYDLAAQRADRGLPRRGIPLGSTLRP